MLARAAPVVFGATVKLTEPLSVPLAPELIVMNELLLTAFQLHGAVADKFFVTVTLPVLPGEKKACVVGETVAHEVGIVTLNAPDQNSSIDALAWSTSGNQIAAAIGGVVKVWDVASGQPVQTYHEFAGGVYSFAWSPDGTRMAFAGGEMVKVVNGSRPGNVLMFGGHSGNIQTFAWSPDGTRIATVDDYGVHIWDTGTGKEVCSLQNSGVLSVSWSPDGKRIATAGSDPEVDIWRVAPCAAQPTNAYPGAHHHTIITSAAWSPNGKEVASVDNAGALSVWDPNTMRDLVRPYDDTAIDPGTSGFELTSVAWSHDSSLIAFSHDEGEQSGYSSSRVVIVSIS